VSERSAIALFADTKPPSAGERMAAIDSGMAGRISG